MALMTPHLPETCTNYYELLGLAAFAADLQVIDARAKELMKEARKYQVGRYATQAEKYLNLLGEARHCLLDASRKAKYDEDLRNQWQMPPVTVTTTFQLSEPQNEIPDFSSVELPLSSRRLAARARRNCQKMLLVAVPAILLLCAVLGVLGVWLMASQAAGGAIPLDEAVRQVFGSKNSGDHVNQPGEK